MKNLIIIISLISSISFGAFSHAQNCYTPTNLTSSEDQSLQESPEIFISTDTSLMARQDPLTIQFTGGERYLEDDENGSYTFLFLLNGYRNGRLITQEYIVDNLYKEDFEAGVLLFNISSYVFNEGLDEIGFRIAKEEEWAVAKGLSPPMSCPYDHSTGLIDNEVRVKIQSENLESPFNNDMAYNHIPVRTIVPKASRFLQLFNNYQIEGSDSDLPRGGIATSYDRINDYDRQSDLTQPSSSETPTLSRNSGSFQFHSGHHQLEDLPISASYKNTLSGSTNQLDGNVRVNQSILKNKTTKLSLIGDVKVSHNVLLSGKKDEPVHYSIQPKAAIQLRHEHPSGVTLDSLAQTELIKTEEERKFQVQARIGFDKDFDKNGFLASLNAVSGNDLDEKKSEESILIGGGILNSIVRTLDVDKRNGLNDEANKILFDAQVGFYSFGSHRSDNIEFQSDAELDETLEVQSWDLKANKTVFKNKTTKLDLVNTTHFDFNQKSYYKEEFNGEGGAEMRSKHSSSGSILANIVKGNYEKKGEKDLEYLGTHIANRLSYDPRFDKQGFLLDATALIYIENRGASSYRRFEETKDGIRTEVKTQVGYGIPLTLEGDSRLTPFIGLNFDNLGNEHLDFNLFYEDHGSRAIATVDNTGNVVFKLKGYHKW